MLMPKPIPRAWRGLLLLSFIASLAACADDEPSDAAPSCGEGTEEVMGVCLPQATSAKPLVEGVALDHLELSPGPYQINYPIDVHATLSATGESFKADAVVGFRSASAQAGCLLGGFAVEHNATQPVVAQVSETYQIPEDCGALIGQPDVEVFFAFDLFHTVDLVGRDEAAIEAGGEELEIVDQALASQIGTEGCVDGQGEACELGLEVAASPGLDLRITGLSVDSTVLVLPLAYDEGVELTAEEVAQSNAAAGVEDEGVPLSPTERIPAQAPTSPHLEAAVLVQVDGLAIDEPLAGKAYLTYGIRPLPDAAGVARLPEDARRWQALYSEQDEDAAPVFFEDAEIRDIVGGHERGKASAVYIRDGLDAQLDRGDWMGINEFELRVCVSLEEPEAGDLENNCATRPIIILRNPYDTSGRPQGARDGVSQATACGAAGVACDRFIEQLGWSDDAFSSSVNVKIWKEQGASNTAAVFEIGEKGEQIQGVGSWFEAGVFANASFKGQSFTIIDLYLSAINNQTASDELHLGFELANQDVIPDASLSWNDNALTLSEILALASAHNDASYSTTFTLRYPIVGVSTSVRRGSVSAGVFADLELGVDPAATALSQSVIEPTANPCEGKPTTNGLCYAFVDMGAGKNFFQYEDHCESLGGAPAPLRDADDHAAILAARGESDAAAWVGAFLPALTNITSAPGDGSEFDHRWEHRAPDALNVAQGLPLINFHPNRSAFNTFKVPFLNTTMLGANYGLVLVWQDSDQYKAWRAGSTSRRYGVCAFVDGAGDQPGLRLNATLTPFVDVEVSAELSISWRFIRWTIGVTLSLLKLEVPFSADLDLLMSSINNTLAVFRASIDATLRTLSGKIYFEVRWKNFWGRTKKSTKTLAEWDGIVLGTWNLLTRGPYVKAF